MAVLDSALDRVVLKYYLDGENLHKVRYLVHPVKEDVMLDAKFFPKAMAALSSFGVVSTEKVGDPNTSEAALLSAHCGCLPGSKTS